jgi:hypothetical protein
MSGGGVRTAQIQQHSPRVNSCFRAADTCNPLSERIQLSGYAAALRYSAGGGVK